MSQLPEYYRTIVAYALYDAGFAPTWSSDICDQLIAGYGNLDYDFEYPLLVLEGKVVPYSEIPKSIQEWEKFYNHEYQEPAKPERRKFIDSFSGACVEYSFILLHKAHSYVSVHGAADLQQAARLAAAIAQSYGTTLSAFNSHDYKAYELKPRFHEPVPKTSWLDHWFSWCRFKFSF